jgi:hypothetical protein
VPRQQPESVAPRRQRLSESLLLTAAIAAATSRQDLRSQQR